eukprot:TRINITY_DN21059_c0_g1_i1.p1 TRINITY_DN21059_c0_g1~~TRINITY_DN21059_c0_g1_i1.p1  ORF type:complete len:192 (-),score=12.73 TRINITY_DN21059_c0_g1_i1:33-608(-)
MNILASVGPFFSVFISLNSSDVNDEGCLALIYFLKSSPALKQLTLWMNSARITNEGFSYIWRAIASLPLKSIHLTFRSTNITDEIIYQLSDSIFQIFSYLTEFGLSVQSTQISDLGALNIIKVISFHPNLSSLNLNFESSKITSRTLDSLIELVITHTKLVEVMLSLKYTKTTKDEAVSYTHLTLPTIYSV